MKKKTLFLHIGCGKTGSSALQVWLNNNARALGKCGVDYPTFGRADLDAYAITSGNGVHLLHAIKGGELPKFLQLLTKSKQDKILISSESFQSLNAEQLAELVRHAEALNIDVSIIAYVRDVYDIVYSSYQQWVKRHLGNQSFREFGLSRNNIQQFEVLKLYRQYFKKIAVLHYDSERLRGLEVALCEVLGVGVGDVPSMPVVKVNRSLDSVESELLRIANDKYVVRFAQKDNSFSRLISDALIYLNPEQDTEILLDEVVLLHLQNLCQTDIDDVNRNFLKQTPLRVFSPDGKRIMNSVPELPSAYSTLMESVMIYFSKDKSRDLDVRSAPPALNVKVSTSKLDESAENSTLLAKDPRVANALRDEAIRLEKKDLTKAIALMSAAAALRPSGQLITKKLEQYRRQLSDSQS